MTYLLLKSAHVAAVLVWVGGLLMLAVALASLGRVGEPILPPQRRWLVAVQRWERRVTVPAMALVWVLGVTVAVRGGWFASAWLGPKLVLVVGLSALHGMMAGLLRRALRDGHWQAAKWVSYAAPAIVAAAALIAVLATAKPF